MYRYKELAMKDWLSTELGAIERERLLSLAQSLKLKRKPNRSQPITRIDGNDRLSLSFAQQRLWFLAQMEGVSEAYHIPWGVRLKGELDRAALRQALDRIVERHEALRTTFGMIDGEAVQRIRRAEESRFDLVEEETGSGRAGEEEVRRRVEEEAGGRLIWREGP